MRSTDPAWAIFLILAIATTLVRAPAVTWSVLREDGVHVPIETDESTFVRHTRKYPKYEPTYVQQAATHALLIQPVVRFAARIFGLTSEIDRPYFTYVVGRIASMLAGLGFAALVLFGGAAFGLATLWERALAAYLLSFSPLISAYSHLFLADVANLLWIWLSYFAFVRFARTRDDREVLLFAIAAGFAGATKFSLPYCVVPALALLVISSRRWFHFTLLAVAGCGAFWLGNGLNYSVEQLLKARVFLSGVHDGKVEVDLLRNLLVQPAFLAVGVGLPTLALSLWAAVARLKTWRCSWTWASATLRNPGAWISAHPLGVATLGLIPGFAWLIGSAIGGSFARHVIPFLPVFVFSAVRQLSSLPARRVRVVGALWIVYQLALCLDGERAYYRDVRQQARAWLRANRPADVPVFADYYAAAAVDGLPMVTSVRSIGPSPVPSLKGEHFFATHQMTYGRYLLAERCEEILHCLGGDRALRFFRELNAGKSTKYDLAFSAEHLRFMPEYLWVRRLVPTHPFPDVGAIRIYRSR